MGRHYDPPVFTSIVFPLHLPPVDTFLTSSVGAEKGDKCRSIPVGVDLFRQLGTYFKFLTYKIND